MGHHQVGAHIDSLILYHSYCLWEFLSSILFPVFTSIVNLGKSFNFLQWTFVFMGYIAWFAHILVLTYTFPHMKIVFKVWFFIIYLAILLICTFKLIKMFNIVLYCGIYFWTWIFCTFDSFLSGRFLEVLYLSQSTDFFTGSFSCSQIVFKGDYIDLCTH
jgi:hypothetical protein